MSSSDAAPPSPGRVRPMGRVFARASFLPSLALNLLMERVTTRCWYSAIDSTVILGALPFKSMTQELVERLKVRGVVSMNEDYELRYLSNSPEEWCAAGVKFLQLSTTDMFEAPCQDKLRRGVDFILQFHSRQFASLDGALPTAAGDADGPAERVYVHCKAGRTRSACLVACYLMQVYGMTPIEAVEHMTAKRPHIWLGRQQHAAIHTFYESLLSDRERT